MEFTRFECMYKSRYKTVFVPGTDVTLHSDDGHGEYFRYSQYPEVLL